MRCFVRGASTGIISTMLSLVDQLLEEYHFNKTSLRSSYRDYYNSKIEFALLACVSYIMLVM